ncbi:MAG: hypothetical protein II940_01035, partial [Methanosarcinaceae archaeon]|nr:hypothetical protein [Methanosarcinaceae archaeon]
SEISEAAAEANVDVMIISEMIRTKKERTVAPDTGGHLNKALLIFVIAVLSHFFMIGHNQPKRIDTYKCFYFYIVS